jgi:hypothetical protein
MTLTTDAGHHWIAWDDCLRSISHVSKEFDKLDMNYRQGLTNGSKEFIIYTSRLHKCRESAMPKTIDPQLQTMIANLPEKTGKSLPEWFQALTARKLENHGEIMKFLKADQGVTHGFANTISSLYLQELAGGASSTEDLLEAQYAGPKAALRPIYEAILAAISTLGPGIEIAPKKTYVSLRRSKQFAIVKPATRARVDLGLNLKDVDQTDRLEGGKVFSGMCTHLVRLTSPSEVDEELISWIEQAILQA